MHASPRTGLQNSLNGFKLHLAAASIKPDADFSSGIYNVKVYIKIEYNIRE
jgi:hypothetical protein